MCCENEERRYPPWCDSLFLMFLMLLREPVGKLKQSPPYPECPGTSRASGAQLAVVSVVFSLCGGCLAIPRDKFSGFPCGHLAGTIVSYQLGGTFASCRYPRAILRVFRLGLS